MKEFKGDKRTKAYKDWKKNYDAKSKGAGDTVEKITKKKAKYNHALQTLCGDNVDNFPGVPGIGPVKAAAILNTKDLWSAIEAAFVKAKLTKEDALLQARLAYILQHGDYNFKSKKIITNY